MQVQDVEKRFSLQVSMSDEILADREETIESLQQQVKKLEKRTREVSSELESTQEEARRAESKWKEAEERSRRFKSEVIRLTEVQGETEDRTGRLEALKKALELENDKLKENMEEKEALVKVSKIQCVFTALETDREGNISQLASYFSLNRRLFFSLVAIWGWPFGRFLMACLRGSKSKSFAA
jgi:chromosome segregation ATPase